MADCAGETVGRWAQRQEALGVETHGENLTLREIEFVERFLAAGHRLEWIARDTVTFTPTNDFIWLDNCGLPAELKTTKSRYKTIRNQIHPAVAKAHAHGAVKENFMIDLGRSSLPDKLRKQLSQYNRRTAKYRIARLWVMAKGRIEEITLV